jgi:hypothetical protein
MLALLLSAWMVLPAFPLNPTDQDTLATSNLHFSAGFRGASDLVTAGPGVNAIYELMVWHPIVARLSIGYGYGSIASRLYPQGEVQSGTVAVEGLYYRGSDKLTGYIGFGVLYSRHSLSLEDGVRDSLWRDHSIDEVKIEDSPGFRLIMGIRRDVRYSLELSITEIRPKFLYRSRFSTSAIAELREKVRLNDYRIMIGYLFEL